MKGPNMRLFSNQRSNLLLLIEKQAADNKTKGVVGSSGKKMPNVPNASEMLPAIIYAILRIFSDINKIKNRILNISLVRPKLLEATLQNQAYLPQKP